MSPRSAEDSHFCSQDANLLRARLQSVLDLAQLLLDEVLDPRFGKEDPDAYRNLVGKATGELAMLLRIARRALTDAADVETITRLASALASHARARHVYRLLLLRPSRAAMHALAHFCLEDLGCRDASFDRVARLALCSSVCHANERVPYRILDAAWVRHLAFGYAELDHPAILLSPIGASVDLLQATAEDAYAFTHALPYATDFGRFALPERIDRTQLLGVAEALAVKALDEDDLDLLAEILMTPALLQLPWTPTLAFAWSVLSHVWDDFGFVPGPGLPAAADDETRNQTVRRVFGTMYHTTFAAGLCCATLLACNAEPPALSVDASGGVVAPPGRGAAWKGVWERIGHQAQEQLVFLRLGFELRRAVDDVDLTGVYRILQQATDVGFAEHPLFIQGLELLERVHASETLPVTSELHRSAAY